MNINIFSLGLALVPATIIAERMHAPGQVLFIMAALAILPIARFIGKATEEVASVTNAGIGGLLNATFGNAVELMIGFIALSHGLTEVVKASITGSIIGNLLLVVGVSMIAGGLKHKDQTFNKTSVAAASATLLLAVIAMVVPAIFVATSGDIGHGKVENLSVLVAILMILTYIGTLIFSLRTHKHLYVEEIGKYTPKWSVKKSLVILALATAGAAWMSEILVSSIEPIAETFGWTELFIGVIIVAIVGNLTEHASAITIAMKNRMDLSLHIAIGSATQIALFVMPLLVLISMLMSHHMDIVFTNFELVAIIASVLITNLVVQDGESNWLEGLQLVTAYAILGVAFYLHP